MAGIKAMTTKLNSKPPMVSTVSICSVAAAAVSSKAFNMSSSVWSAPLNFIFSFHTVSWLVTGIETNITAMPARRNNSHGLLMLRKPKSSIWCSLRVTK